MSAIPRPERNPECGELVNYFEGGDPTEVPFLATVHAVYSGGSVTLTYQKPGNIVVLTRTSVKHIHSPYWDNVPITARQALGAFDFHPIYKGLFDKWVQAAAMREAKRQQIESEKNELSPDEYTAIAALERHGDNISKICEETGFTPAKLKKLVRFNEDLGKVKDANFVAKNAE